jgi:farnesyl diphosphate synthase
MALASSPFLEWARLYQARIEQVLEAKMPAQDTTPSRLHQAMRYAALGGGKRVRALLAYAAGEFCGASPTHVDIPAAAVELIHAFSLVHDDMPCMDDDDLRRGKPSTHKQYDDATALLAGDALQSLAFELVSAPDLALPSAQKAQLLHLLAFATGSRGMAGGQSIDLESTNLTLSREALEHMHQLKTGALIRASVLAGAYCAPEVTAQKLTTLEHYSATVGLAFQVVDDILDVVADTMTLGKTSGKDAEANKSTYVTLLGLSEAKALAQALHEQAHAYLSPYQREANTLRQLADFILQRSF